MANYLGSASDLLRHFGDEDDAELDDIPPPGVDGKIFNFLFLHDDTIMMDRDEGEESVDEYKRPTSRKGSSNWYRGLAQQLPKDECSICLCGFDGSDSVELSCGHVFCENCLQEYLKFELSQSWTKVKHTVSSMEKDNKAFRLRVETVFGVRCPQRNCLHVISSEHIQRLVDKPLFEKFQRFALKFVLEDMKGQLPLCLRQCGGYIQENCLCTNDRCRMLTERERVIREKNLLRDWRKQNSRAHINFGNWARESKVACCPKCFSAIFKDGGCNHMYCTVCKTKFNWTEADKFGGPNHWYKPTGPSEPYKSRAQAT